MSEPSEDTKAVVKAVVEYVTEHAERESRFLTPNPQWMLIAPELLLEMLEERFSISTEEMGKWSNAQADKKAAKK